MTANHPHHDGAMSDPDDFDDPPERERLSDEDLFLAGLVGKYAERRERGLPPRAHDLLALAAEFGDDAPRKLRVVLALYEALIADDTSP
jgi:hypothetical protein